MIMNEKRRGCQLGKEMMKTLYRPKDRRVLPDQDLNSFQVLSPPYSTSRRLNECNTPYHIRTVRLHEGNTAGHQVVYQYKIVVSTQRGRDGPFETLIRFQT